MADFRIDVGLVSHPKTIKLMRRCGDRSFFCLVSLWAWATINRCDGVLSGLDSESVEIAAGWNGTAGDLVRELIDVGFIDEDESGEYRLHEWSKHNPWAAGAEERKLSASRAGKISAAKRKLATEGQRPVNAPLTTRSTTRSTEGQRPCENGPAEACKKEEKRPAERKTSDQPAAGAGKRKSGAKKTAKTSTGKQAVATEAQRPVDDPFNGTSTPSPSPSPSPLTTTTTNGGGAPKVFRPPTVDEVAAYCRQRGNKIDPEYFVDRNTATGWMYGKTRMRDWKAVVRTWERNDKTAAVHGGGRPRAQSVRDVLIIQNEEIARVLNEDERRKQLDRERCETSGVLLEHTVPGGRICQ